MAPQQYAVVRQSEHEHAYSKEPVIEEFIYHKQSRLSLLKIVSSLAAFLVLGILVGFTSSGYLHWKKSDTHGTSLLQQTFFPSCADMFTDRRSSC